MRFPEEILKSRSRSIQENLKRDGLDAAVIRTMSTFIYVTGIKWMRPSLIIPADGEPVVLVADGEEDGFKSTTWIKNVLSYSDGGQLMGEVVKYLKDIGAHRVGMEYTLERDTFAFFYDLFKKLNPSIEVVDITENLGAMKMMKDRYEIDCIEKAGKMVSSVAEEIKNIIRPGMTETELAAEAYYRLYRAGSEEPLVYVNAGPNPRVHAEPLSTVKIPENGTVTVTLDGDFMRYYVNKSFTVPLGDPGETARKAIECVNEAQRIAAEKSVSGTKFISVMTELDNIYGKYGMLKYRVIGYAHSVGLEPEERPLTTIIPKDRFVEIRQGMVLAFGHAPLMIPGIGSIKNEETYEMVTDRPLRIT